VDKRLNSLTRWAKRIFADDGLRISPASADASFRRYFRVSHQRASHIIMDAPPEKEDSEPFVRLSAYLNSLNLNAPEVLDSDDEGFYLLSDLGSAVYLDVLGEDNADAFYADALQALLMMQTKGSKDDARIPDYTKERLLSEMHLFDQWYLAIERGYSIDSDLAVMFDTCYEFLAKSALRQPQVFVHRDYHSRNLMYIETLDSNITNSNIINSKEIDHDKIINPGILDFQDAVWGPVTYDLVSLLRDCYIAWPEEQVETWVRQYFSKLMAHEIINVDEAQFIRWFDLMGIQRHLKASGIFARLKHRDSKLGYMKDIPRTLNYILSTARKYPQLDDLVSLLEQLDIPPRPAVAMDKS